MDEILHPGCLGLLAIFCCFVPKANFFNDDEDPRNGCEATCPTVPGGECKVWGPETVRRFGGRESDGNLQVSLTYPRFLGFV